MAKGKNYKRIFGIIGIVMFIGSIVFIKVINVYDLFLNDRFGIIGVILPIIMLGSIILAFRYLDTLKFY